MTGKVFESKATSAKMIFTFLRHKHLMFLFCHDCHSDLLFYVLVGYCHARNLLLKGIVQAHNLNIHTVEKQQCTKTNVKTRKNLYANFYFYIVCTYFLF